MIYFVSLAHKMWGGGGQEMSLEKSRRVRLWRSLSMMLWYLWSYLIGSRKALKCLCKGMRESDLHFLSVHAYSSLKDRHKGFKLGPRRRLLCRYWPWWMEVIKASIYWMFITCQVLFIKYFLCYSVLTRTLMAKFYYLYFVVGETKA